MKSPGTNAQSVIAIVPVNILAMSKARLAPSLNAALRRRLSTAMLADVLTAMRKVRTIRRITVVSADRSVARLAHVMAAHFLWEGERRGLNKGLRLALLDASRRKASAALILPADIPLVTPREISRFLRLSDGRSIAITPSKDGAGTNALLLRPPRMIKPSFGENSFRRHTAAAKQKGLTPKVIKLRGISLDVDEPRDLARLRGAPPRSETGRLVRSVDNQIKV